MPGASAQPRLSPFVLPLVVRLPSTKPATPYSDTCASETMPP